MGFITDLFGGTKPPKKVKPLKPQKVITTEGGVIRDPKDTLIAAALADQPSSSLIGESTDAPLGQV